MTSKQIPFFPNTSDGTHCFQAALKTTLSYFMPEYDFSYDELDIISAKVKDKWTWPTAAMLWLIDEGFELLLIEEFDYAAFAKKGEDYLIKKCGREVAEAQIKNSEMEKEREYARRFADLAPIEKRMPTFKDIKKLLDEGYLIICNINSAIFSGAKGYAGHFVVICVLDDDALTIHDPGIPPRPFLKVSRAVFEKAWAYPTKNEKNLLAIRLEYTQRHNSPFSPS